MTNEKIYKEAMNLLGESVADGDNEDMEERAPYLIAAFCNEVSEVDRALREAEGDEKEVSFDTTWIALTDPFPLVPRLSSAACLYLASMLVIDEDPELSDKLYDRYCDSVATICSHLPASIETIIDRYS